jgi:shikimate kinase
MNIVLIGLRGSGKTACGELLAQRLGWRFVDTDAQVQQRVGLTIKEIFEREGEAGFRKREVEAVRAAAALDHAVIATGGGAILDARNVAALRAHGFVVHLSASPEVLWRRISADPLSAAQRPPLAKAPGADTHFGPYGNGLSVPGALEELQRLLLARAAAYHAARDVEVVVEERTPEQVVEAVLLLMRVRGIPVS